MIDKEVEELKTQISSLNQKLDSASIALSNIQQTLARQEGNNIPNRVFQLEEKSQGIEKYQAERSWIPKAVEENVKDIKNLYKYLYMGLGVLAFLQVIFTAIAGFILKVIFLGS